MTAYANVCQECGTRLDGRDDWNGTGPCPVCGKEGIDHSVFLRDDIGVTDAVDPSASGAAKEK